MQPKDLRNRRHLRFLLAYYRATVVTGVRCDALFRALRGMSVTVAYLTQKVERFALLAAVGAVAVGVLVARLSVAPLQSSRGSHTATPAPPVVE